MRALPSGMEIAFAVLAVVSFAQDSALLKCTVFVLGLYVLLVNQVAYYLDPECEVPEHEHDDCPACADLPPLVPVRNFVRRMSRKGA
jgi:hypothetical protein